MTARRQNQVLDEYFPWWPRRRAYLLQSGRRSDCKFEREEMITQIPVFPRPKPLFPFTGPRGKWRTESL